MTVENAQTADAHKEYDSRKVRRIVVATRLSIVYLETLIREWLLETTRNYSKRGNFKSEPEVNHEG